MIIKNSNWASWPSETQWPPGYPFQAPSAFQRAEFIPSAAEGGFPLLSLAEFTYINFQNFIIHLYLITSNDYLCRLIF